MGSIDLMILTHQDDDHIRGLLYLLKDENNRRLVKSIWFNSFEHDRIFNINSNSQTSTADAMKFDDLATAIKEENSNFTYKNSIYIEKYSNIELFQDIDIDLLSPTESKLKKMEDKYLKEKEEILAKQSNSTASSSIDNSLTLDALYSRSSPADTTPSNGSSIAFILNYRNKYKFLLLADAHISTILVSLKNMGFSKKNKLKVNFVKLSHHGSKYNFNLRFLSLIDTNTFIISTDGRAHNHPDVEVLSKIILDPMRKDKNGRIEKEIFFLFNYKEVCSKLKQQVAFNEESRKKFKFSLLHVSEYQLTFE